MYNNYTTEKFLIYTVNSLGFKELTALAFPLAKSKNIFRKLVPEQAFVLFKKTSCKFSGDFHGLNPLFSAP